MMLKSCNLQCGQPCILSGFSLKLKSVVFSFVSVLRVFMGSLFAGMGEEAFYVDSNTAS